MDEIEVFTIERGEKSNDKGKQEVPLYIGSIYGINLPERYSDECVRFSKNYISGTCNYHCEAVGDQRVEFINEHKGIRRLITDKDASIIDFSGIEYDEVWTKEYINKLEIAPEVKYSASFYEFPDNEFIMLWCIQQDGRYWMDSDGFGDEGCEEIVLYSTFDNEGKLTHPFKLFSIGNKLYFKKCRT